MPNTPRKDLPYPQGSDRAFVPDDIRKLAEALDNTADIDQGLLANRGSPGAGSRFYWAADANDGAGMLYYDDGSVWKEIGPGVIPDGSVTTTKITNAAVTPVKVSEPVGAASTGVIDVPNGTGTFNVVCGFRPKLVRFTVMQDFNLDTLSAIGVGAATSPTNRWAMYTRSSGTDIHLHRIVQSRCVYTLASDGTTQLAIDYAATLPDGFTLNVLTNLNQGHKVAWEAFA